MKSENYITIQGWMINELGLKGNELLCYAIIYGFSQDGESVYSGTASYLAESIGMDKKRIFDVLKRLTEKGLIEKIEKTVNGVKLCDYKTQQGVMKCNGGGCEMQLGGGDEMQPHNNNIDNNKEKENIKRKENYGASTYLYSGKFMQWWNTSFASNKTNVIGVKVFNKTRESKFMARFKEMKSIMANKLGKTPADDDVFTNITNMLELRYTQSDFLSGRTSVPFKLDVDFVLQESSFLKIYEGKYGNN